MNIWRLGTSNMEKNKLEPKRTSQVGQRSAASSSSAQQQQEELIQHLQRALEEKQLQCEALFQAKQSMELSIRQIISGENQADVFLQLENSLEEERQRSKQCMEEKERLVQSNSQMEREWREKVDSLETQLAEWKEKAAEAFHQIAENKEVIRKQQNELSESKQRVETLETQLSQVKSKAKEFIHSKLAEIRAENASLKELLASKEEASSTSLEKQSEDTIKYLGYPLQNMVSDCKHWMSSLETEVEECDSYFQGLFEHCSNLCSLLENPDREDASEDSKVGVDKLKRLLASMDSKKLEKVHNRCIEISRLLVQMESCLSDDHRGNTNCEEQVQTEESQSVGIQDTGEEKEEQQACIDQLRRELESERERGEELKRALDKLTTIDSKRRDKLANLEKDKTELELALQKLREEYNALKEAKYSSSLERMTWTTTTTTTTAQQTDMSEMTSSGLSKSTTDSTSSQGTKLVDEEGRESSSRRLLDEIEEIVHFFGNHIDSCSHILESLTTQILSEGAAVVSRDQWSSMKQELDKAREEKETLEKELSQREQQLEQLRENFRNAMQNFAKEKQELQKEHEEESEQYQSRLRQIQQENQSLHEKVHQLKSELARQEEMLGEKQSSISNLELLLERERQTGSEWREQVSRIKEEFLKYKEKARTALGQRDKTIREVDSLLEKTNEEHRLQLDNLKSQVVQLEEKISQLVKEKETMVEQERIKAKEKQKQLEEELLQVKEEKSKRLEESFATLTERESKILSLESKLEESNMEIRRLEMSLEEQSTRLQEEKQQLEKKIEELTWQNADLQSKIQSLQKELNRWERTSKSRAALSNNNNNNEETTTTATTTYTENDWNLCQEQLEFMKKEWRELNEKYQAAQKLKEDITFEYLRNVILRFLQTDDLDTLLPVISRILQFSDEQIEEILEKRKLLTRIRNAFKK